MCSFRKVKRELVSEISDTTWIGASVSIGIICVILWLVYSELVSFLTVTTTSRLIFEHPRSTSDDTLQVCSTSFAIGVSFLTRASQMVFDIDFPRLHCEYCRIQATNFMGTHNAGLATRVNKYHLDYNGDVISKHVSLKSPLRHETIDGDREPTNATLALDVHNFEDVRAENPLLLVNLCTPDNAWCKKLAPVWDKVAALLRAAHSDGKDGVRFALGTVNCKELAGQAICTDFEARRRARARGARRLCVCVCARGGGAMRPPRSGGRALRRVAPPPTAAPSYPTPPRRPSPSP